MQLKSLIKSGIDMHIGKVHVEPRGDNELPNVFVQTPTGKACICADRGWLIEDTRIGITCFQCAPVIVPPSNNSFLLYSVEPGDRQIVESWYPLVSYTRTWKQFISEHVAINGKEIVGQPAMFTAVAILFEVAAERIRDQVCTVRYRGFWSLHNLKPSILSLDTGYEKWDLIAAVCAPQDTESGAWRIVIPQPKCQSLLSQRRILTLGEHLTNKGIAEESVVALIRLESTTLQDRGYVNILEIYHLSAGKPVSTPDCPQT